MVSKLFRFIGQIVRIHADAVSSHQPRKKFQEIPFSSRRFQYGLCINPHFIKDNGQLVHKGNIDVPLAVFNDFGRFCHFDGRSSVDACFHHQFINAGCFFQCFLVHAGYNFGNGFQAVHLIAGIDTFRRISDFKVSAAYKA